MKYILSIDQGTTGSTALLYDPSQKKFIDAVNTEFKQHFPRPSWVEHDLNEIWESVATSVTRLLTKNDISGRDICAIGITNQRETTTAFNSKANPLAPAIVWQDRRTQDFCHQNKDNFKKFMKVTGLPLDPYFSASKINWLINNNQNVKDAIAANDIKFGTIDTYLLYRLSGRRAFKTEPSNASRTNLMSLETLDWHNELLSFFDVKREWLPEISETFGNFGETKDVSFLPDGIPICCLIGDQQSALFGQGCIENGELKCTYGTGAFLLQNTGSEITYSENGLLTTVALKYQGKTLYALEGSCYIAGASIQWLRDNLGFFASSKESEKLAQLAKDSSMEHIHFFPFFTGLGSPYWNSDAKAAIVGLTRDTSKEHITRACLEGICLSINDLLLAFEQDSGKKISSVKVDGGAVANDFLMQTQANYSQTAITRPKTIETTALGAAVGAYIGLNKLDINIVKELYQEDKVFNQIDNLEYYQKKTNSWKEYINKNYKA